MNFIRRYKVEFTWDSNLITIPERQVLDQSWMATEPIVWDIEWYQFNWWYKLWESEPYDFSTEVNENIILEARLSKNRYNVTYTNVEWVENTSVLFNEDIPLPTPNLLIIAIAPEKHDLILIDGNEYQKAEKCQQET